MLIKEEGSINALLSKGMKQIREKGELKEGDTVVIAGGASVVPSSEETINRIIGGVLKI